MLLATGESPDYFTTPSLLQVLEGVENLVAAFPEGLGHGQMRLITGVFLSEADITALAEQVPAPRQLELVLAELADVD